MSENLENSPFVSLEAEQAVLGALMINAERFDDVALIIDENAFVNLRNRNIYNAIFSLVENKNPVDPITVCEKLNSMGIDPPLDFLTDIYQQVASSANVTAYARVLHECHTKRKIYDASMETVRYMNEHSDISAPEALDYAQSKFMVIGESQNTAEETPMNKALKNYIDRLDELANSDMDIDGLATGLHLVDSRVDGYKPQNLVIIAGRPGQGKTTLALCMAAHFSVIQKKRGIYFSLEMSENELMQKLVASVGKIQLSELKNPRLVSDDFWVKLSATVQRCKDSPLSLVDTPTLHINQAKAFARKAHRRQPLDYLIFDHMHIMDGTGDKNVDKFGSISRGLKNLAKELNIPIFALAQLNRNVEQRINKRPNLSDLRESGNLEQDADIVHFLYRDEYYNQDTMNPGVMEFITAKFRNGEPGTDHLAALLHISHIDNLAPGSYQEPVPPRNTQNLRDSL